MILDERKIPKNTKRNIERISHSAHLIIISDVQYTHKASSLSYATNLKVNTHSSSFGRNL